MDSGPLMQGGKPRLEFLVLSRSLTCAIPASPPVPPSSWRPRIPYIPLQSWTPPSPPLPPPQGGKQRLEFLVPSRGMIGFKTVFVNITRGEGIMARSFQGYGRYRGALQGVRKGEQ